MRFWHPGGGNRDSKGMLRDQQMGWGKVRIQSGQTDRGALLRGATGFGRYSVCPVGEEPAKENGEQKRRMLCPENQEREANKGER